MPESLGPQNRTTWSTFSVKGKNGCRLLAAGCREGVERNQLNKLGGQGIISRRPTNATNRKCSRRLSTAKQMFMLTHQASICRISTCIILLGITTYQSPDYIDCNEPVTILFYFIAQNESMLLQPWSFSVSVCRQLVF